MTSSSIPSAPAHKARPSRLARSLRLVLATVDPRAWTHAVRVINYYNYSHVAERRKLRPGLGARISPNVVFTNAERIEIGARAALGARCYLWAGPSRGRIVLGEDVLIAPQVMITAANYRFNDGSPIDAQAMDEADVVVGRDVWIGYGAVVLPGAHIGDGAVIGAGSVVRGQIPPGAVVAGNPARVVGQRFDRRAAEAPGTTGAAPDSAVLATIAREFPALEAGEIDLPFERTRLDSFDLITLRTALEAAFDRRIPDSAWGSAGSLADIARLPALAGAVPATLMPVQAPAPAAASSDDLPSDLPMGRSLRRLNLNMPQMALSGLGESWLFKELGDIHWAMICRFLQSASAAIADDAGARLYATFTRILLEVDPSLRGFAENDRIEIASGLDRYGAGFFFGRHDVIGPRATARAQTMSTFAKYGERGRNTSLMKGTPVIPDPGAIPALPEFPAFGADYRTRRAADPGPVLFETTYEILPPHDINGVGLLYFAAYPTVFDLCLERAEGKGFLAAHSTAMKDICYFANSEPDETLVFRLHARAEEAGGLVRHVATLSRQSDGVRMAEATSLKRRLG